VGGGESRRRERVGGRKERGREGQRADGFRDAEREKEERCRGERSKKRGGGLEGMEGKGGE